MCARLVVAIVILFEASSSVRMLLAACLLRNIENGCLKKVRACTCIGIRGVRTRIVCVYRQEDVK